MTHPLLRAVFSDKLRWLKMAALALVILAAGWYRHRHRKVTIYDCVAAPDTYDRIPVALGNLRAKNVTSEGFEIVVGGRELRALGPTRDLREGEYIEAYATFHRQADLGYIQIEELFIRRGRVLKIIISALAVPILAWLFLREYRFDPRRFIFLARQR